MSYARLGFEMLKELTAGSGNPISEGDRKRLDEGRRVDLGVATFVISSWENRWAKAGGVWAVTLKYASYLSSQRRKVLVVTPLHTGLGTAPGALRPTAVLWHDFDGKRHCVEVFEDEWADVRWIYIHCEGFFTADGGKDRTNPYLYEDDDHGQSPANTSPRLVRDCLFFAVVLPKVLAAMLVTDNVVFHLQDWETAAVAVTVKSAILKKQIRRAISILVLHNPYDKYLGSVDWTMLTEWPEPSDTPSTFLGRSLPFLDARPATVSREFAVALVTDRLQTDHLADHLQAQFRRFGIVGVDNGPFEEVVPPFSVGAILAARAGRPDAILSEKQQLRDTMKSAMAAYRPAGRWGDVDFAALPDHIPVFMCVGRLDPGQKGFDVAARAIEIVLREGLDARFVLTPIVGSAPQPYVDDLQALAEARAHLGRVVVFPFRMEVGYFETQGGCTFAGWPSMYEPFGGVSEFFLRGTPVLARSTGGLRQQVVNFDRSTGDGNGVLYETIDPPLGSGEWRTIQMEEIPVNRMKHQVYIDQVEQFAEAIRNAVDIFRDRDAYGRLLSNVPGSCAGYSWERAAAEYSSLYDMAREP